MPSRNDAQRSGQQRQRVLAGMRLMRSTRTARVVTDEAARVGEQTARAGADIANREHRDGPERHGSRV